MGAVLPRILDRYVTREIIPPFLLALLVFTFVRLSPSSSSLRRT
jgi:lipopolysaccharide export LptBFGC system permease protein LptF